MKINRDLLNNIKLPFASALRWGLRFTALRHRLIFELQQNYYSELGVTVSLGDGIHCPIVSLEHWASYQNIFVEKEYDPLLARIPLPARWLDLGCHAGHFTLLMMKLHARAGTSQGTAALLLDPDPRVEPAINAIRKVNPQAACRFQFLQGAIGDGSESLAFSEGAYMTSKIVTQTNEHTRPVPCLNETAIMQALPPPYDLIKLDVEGGEYHFLRHYPQLLARTRHLLFEWHSWHPGGGGRAQLLEMAEALNFELIAEEYSGREVPQDGGIGSTGVILMVNRNFKN